VKRASELSAKGLMHPAGLAAFSETRGKTVRIYIPTSKEKSAKLPAA
jgi:hypothetical protein